MVTRVRLIVGPSKPIAAISDIEIFLPQQFFYPDKLYLFLKIKAKKPRDLCKVCFSGNLIQNLTNQIIDVSDE